MIGRNAFYCYIFCPTAIPMIVDSPGKETCEVHSSSKKSSKYKTHYLLSKLYKDMQLPCLPQAFSTGGNIYLPEDQ